MRKAATEKIDNRVGESTLKRAALIAAGGLLSTAVGAAAAGQIKTVFVIAMENHNWTQPASQTSPGQIFGNVAAPYINSLVTPGNPNAAQVSYASNYQNVGAGVTRPSRTISGRRRARTSVCSMTTIPSKRRAAQTRRRPTASAITCN